MTADAYFEELLSRIVNDGVCNKHDLHRVKMDLCGKYGMARVPSDSEVLTHASPEMRDMMVDLLRVKRTRSASGVAVVSVMTKPGACPHGRCIYCPGGPEAGTPQSYTGTEPAAMRAAQHAYEPYGQTSARLEQLRAMGHPTDKIELIVIGGTFTHFNAWYREWFVQRCLDAMNGRTSLSLKEAQTLNETATSRCVGLTIETRPDCFSIDQVSHSLRLGATRVEFGVQSLDDGVLAGVNRGHSVEHVRNATTTAKNAGLKVCYHMMPGLPGSSPDGDLQSFRTLFDDPAFKPDMLKIYPTVVLKGTGLHEMWKRGDYTPLNTEQTVDLIASIKRIVPPWVRIQRIQREIEVPSIQAGLNKGHLRNMARKTLDSSGGRCVCIRCREVGLGGRKLNPSDVELKRTDYLASGGTETFLSLENREGDTLVGYLRMRTCKTGTYIRELKVFGEVVPFGEPPEDRWQHQGYGRALVKEGERIATGDFASRNVKVTSGVGARDYYRKMGYRLEEPYMVKAF